MAKLKMTIEHPVPEEYRDKKDGGCLVTLEDCDDPEYGCSRCPKAMNEYIRKLVKYKVPTPWKNNVWERNGFKYRSNGNATVAVFDSTVPEAVFAGAWWFKKMRPLDPNNWKADLQLYECPYAFALDKMITRVPDRVLWAPEINLILVYPNCMFQVIATAWHEMDEIRELYNRDTDTSAGGVAARL